MDVSTLYLITVDLYINLKEVKIETFPNYSFPMHPFKFYSLNYIVGPIALINVNNCGYR